MKPQASRLLTGKLPGDNPVQPAGAAPGQAGLGLATAAARLGQGLLKATCLGGVESLRMGEDHLELPRSDGHIAVPWSRGAGWLDSHATVEAFSNSIGVSMPRLLWRRCRLWKISRYSKIALASSKRVFHRWRPECQAPQDTGLEDPRRSPQRAATVAPTRRCCDDPLNLGCMPWSEWITRPAPDSSTPCPPESDAR
jgi:hypothetical protein